MSQSPPSSSRNPMVSPLKYSIGYNFAGVATSGDEILKEMEKRARSILERHSPSKEPVSSSAVSSNLFSNAYALNSPPQASTSSAATSRMRRHAMATQQRSPVRNSRRIAQANTIPSSPKLDSPLRRLNLGPPPTTPTPNLFKESNAANADLDSPKRRANGPESPTKRRKPLDTQANSLSSILPPPPSSMPVRPSSSSMPRSASIKSLAQKTSTTPGSLKDSTGLTIRNRVISGEVRVHSAPRSAIDRSVNNLLKPPPSLMVRSKSQNLRQLSASQPSETSKKPDVAKKTAPSLSIRPNSATPKPPALNTGTAPNTASQVPPRLPRSATFNVKASEGQRETAESKPWRLPLQHNLRRPVSGEGNNENEPSIPSYARPTLSSMRRSASTTLNAKPTTRSTSSRRS